MNDTRYIDKVTERPNDNALFIALIHVVKVLPSSDVLDIEIFVGLVVASVAK